MVATPGVAASISMPSAIKAMVSTIAGLRPARSASAPITTPPSGRIRKPDQNTARDESRLLVGSLDGKKARPISTAKNEKVMKS